MIFQIEIYYPPGKANREGEKSLFFFWRATFLPCRTILAVALSRQRYYAESHMGMLLQQLLTFIDHTHELDRSMIENSIVLTANFISQVSIDTVWSFMNFVSFWIMFAVSRWVQYYANIFTRLSWRFLDDHSLLNDHSIFHNRNRYCTIVRDYKVISKRSHLVMSWSHVIQFNECNQSVLIPFSIVFVGDALFLPFVVYDLHMCLLHDDIASF